MIISHHHKFVFIKTRKTASTSVEIALSAICEHEDIITPMDQSDETFRQEKTGKAAQNYRIPWSEQNITDLVRSLKHFKQSSYTNHTSATEVKARMGKTKWDTYFTFCFERQPLAKLISHYQWQKQKGSVKSPQDYIEKQAFLKITATGLYLDTKGQPLVQKVYKMEEMQLALKDIEDRLGLGGKLTRQGELRTKKSEPVKASEIEDLEKAYYKDLSHFFKFEAELYDGF